MELLIRSCHRIMSGISQELGSFDRKILIDLEKHHTAPDTGTTCSRAS
jgi:hypothetical protein